MEMVYNTELSTYNSAPLEQEPKFEPYSLLISPHKLLTTKTVDFDFSDKSLNATEIASRLVETAKYYGSFTITANQCGLPYNLFVCGNDDNYVAFFNAKLIDESDDSILLVESDISNQGLMLPIKRSKTIQISYLDYSGEPRFIKLEGLTSRLVQQCLDRVNGVDFKELVSPLVLARAKKSLNKRVKKFVRQHIIKKVKNNGN